MPRLPSPPRLVVAGWVVALASLLGAVAYAQIPRLDPFPWYAAADSASRRGVVLGVDRFWDDDTGWRAQRLGVTVTVPFGTHSLYFLRAQVWRLDTAALPALTRWPQLRGEDAPLDWPGSVSPTGFGRPELGLVVPIRLPLAGPADAALALGLPLGTDALYPFSSAGWPLRLDVRRGGPLRGAWRWAVAIGAETTFDSSGDALAPDAFPDGWHEGAELAWAPQPWRRIALGYDERRLHGHKSQRATLAAWFPAGGGGAVGLVVARELGPRADRPATDEVSLLWRFAALPATQTGETR